MCTKKLTMAVIIINSTNLTNPKTNLARYHICHTIKNMTSSWIMFKLKVYKVV